MSVLPNVIGVVTELVEDAVLDDQNEIVPGKVKVKLKLKLHNTLGKTRFIWVEGPEDLADFYSSELGGQ